VWVSGQRHTPELYNRETEPVPIVLDAGRTLDRSEREHKISSPTGNAHVTINIYSYFAMLLLYASPAIPLHPGSHLQRNTFIIHAV